MNNTLSPKFLRLLAERGMNVTMLLERAKVGRSAGSQVLNGHRRGPVIRRKITPFLTPEMVRELGWIEKEHTLASCVFQHEDVAIQHAMEAIKTYQGNRFGVLRISTLVHDHPELFGPVAEGQNCLEHLAEWIEREMVNKRKAA